MFSISLKTVNNYKKKTTTTKTTTKTRNKTKQSFHEVCFLGL